MTKIFDTIQGFTARWEGGFVDHPNDPGGATNFGVSLRWLKDAGIDVNKDGKIDVNDVRNLTPALAAQLFKKHFWDKLDLDGLPPRTAAATYDAAVNTGRSQAGKFLQRACNSFPGDKLPETGNILTLTRARAKALDDRALALKCIQMREDFHKRLADSSPYPDGRDYRPFLKGWLSRCSALRNLILGM